jgi:DNA repair exonuclease SbcCD ATPase subunit
MEDTLKKNKRLEKDNKRLEKENEDLRRKHEDLKQNIFKTAYELTKSVNEIKELKKKEAMLNSIIKQMQQQGRGIPVGHDGAVENDYD